MLDNQSTQAQEPSLWHVSPALSAQEGRGAKADGIDKEFYTGLTDKLLFTFYPKTCCNETLTSRAKTRPLLLRCPYCYRQKSFLAGTPLEHLKLNRWVFSYLLRESVISHPAPLTAAQIERRLRVGPNTATRLKRRIQLFATDLLPRMQTVFKQVMIEGFYSFDFPHDKNADISEQVRDVPIPQTDTVVLFSCSTLANKGRKRHKRTGQTSSIYMSESLGGHQRGTLVNTIGIKNGPCFFDSIPNQKASTLNPIIQKYLPHNAPLFSDMGYKFYTGRNHRMVNHGAHSPDKRYRFAKQRWSKNGIHCNVAEGNQSVLKQSFGAYRWIDPRYSQLYLNEYSFIRNLQFFRFEDLAVAPSVRESKPPFRASTGKLCRFGGDLMHGQKSSFLDRKVAQHLYASQTLLEIHVEESRGKSQTLRAQVNSEPDPLIRKRLSRLAARYERWFRTEADRDQRRKQREFERLAIQVWEALPMDSYVEFSDLAAALNISTRNLFRLLPIWFTHGLIEMKDLNRPTASHFARAYDIRRIAHTLTPMRYVLPQSQVAQFNEKWRALARGSK